MLFGLSIWGVLAYIVFLSLLGVEGLLGAEATGLADYICRGLGISQTQPVDQAVVYEETTVTVTAQQAAITKTVDLAAAASCSREWDEYYKNVYSPNVRNVLVTSTLSEIATLNITYGTGSVYTTRASIPVASGNFTPTRTALRILNVTSTIEFNQETTFNRELVNATPKCATLGPKECSSLYVSYISSLGLTSNASVPSITPAPSNSPPCPTYYYKPFTSCYSKFATSYANDCTILGNSVQLFYFPEETSFAALDGQDASAPLTTPPPLVYEYAPGTTFTSPSVYLKFDYLSAERLSNNNYNSICVTCGQQGCVTGAVDGGIQRSKEGTSIAGQLVTLRPEELSSVVLNFNKPEASSIVRTLAKGLPGYPNALQSIVGNFNVSYEPLNLAAYTNPSPEAYYLRPNVDIPGCNFTAPNQQCSTIFEGEYRALVSLPSEVTGLQGPWKSCLPVVYGVYDPPQVLTKASRAAAPTLPGGRTISQYTQPATQPAATLPRPPSATIRPTAAPELLPDNGGTPDAPTLPGNRPGGNTPAQSANLPGVNTPAQSPGGDKPAQHPTGDTDPPAQDPGSDNGDGNSGTGSSDESDNGSSQDDSNGVVQIVTTITESSPRSQRTYQTTIDGTATVATEDVPGSGVRTYETTIPGIVRTATGTVSDRLSTYRTTVPTSDRPESTSTAESEPSGTGLANGASVVNAGSRLLLAGGISFAVFQFVG